jgi:hypothetical protein
MPCQGMTSVMPQLPQHRYGLSRGTQAEKTHARTTTRVRNYFSKLELIRKGTEPSFKVGQGHHINRIPRTAF